MSFKKNRNLYLHIRHSLMVLSLSNFLTCWVCSFLILDPLNLAHLSKFRMASLDAMDQLDTMFQEASITRNVDVISIQWTDREVSECKLSLSTQTVLAFDCEGVSLGRHGELTIIQLSSHKKCFLFDVVGMDRDCKAMVFLKEILESKTIIKVIHDCKMGADALYHIFGINLVGCHDTQQWDEVLREKKENWTIHCNSTTAKLIWGEIQTSTKTISDSGLLVH